MPVELAVDWQAIRLSAVAGVPYKTLAIQWGMLSAQGKPDTTAIRQRASREKWPIPSAIHARAVAAQREAARTTHRARQAISGEKSSKPIDNRDSVTLSPPPENVGFSSKSSGETATVIVTDNLLDLAKSGSLRFAQVAHRSLQAMPDELLIASPSDAATTVKTLRSIAGLDKEGTTVNVAVGGNWGDWPEPEPVTRDVTPDSVNWDEY